MIVMVTGSMLVKFSAVIHFQGRQLFFFPPLKMGLIMQTCLFKYTENFTTKNENFRLKKSDIFHISAQNIDCGYSLELP